MSVFARLAKLIGRSERRSDLHPLYEELIAMARSGSNPAS
jgi:hypothetical protein